MEEKLRKWVRNITAEADSLSGELRKTADGLRQMARHHLRKEKGRASDGKRPLPERPAPAVREMPETAAESPVPDPAGLWPTLTEELDRMIRQAYYADGGFQFYGDSLLRYVQVVLPNETDFTGMWISGYNSCIGPMLRQLEKLERKIEDIGRDGSQEALPPEHEALLETMRQFQRRAQEEGIHRDTGWEAEDYRRILEGYAAELDTLLLTPWRRPEEE